jgi:hypothetical protein
MRNLWTIARNLNRDCLSLGAGQIQQHQLIAFLKHHFTIATHMWTDRGPTNIFIGEKCNLLSFLGNNVVFPHIHAMAFALVRHEVQQIAVPHWK